MLLFDDNKMNMARKPEKIKKANPVGCTTGEAKIWKGNIREGKTGIVLEEVEMKRKLFPFLGKEKLEKKNFLGKNELPWKRKKSLKLSWKGKSFNPLFSAITHGAINSRILLNYTKYGLQLHFSDWFGGSKRNSNRYHANPSIKCN